MFLCKAVRLAPIINRRMVPTMYRNFSSTLRLTQQTPADQKSPAPVPTTKSSNPSKNLLEEAATCRPTSMEKRCLVWTGKYKSMEDVPEFVK